jgi:Lon protease-like protein
VTAKPTQAIALSDAETALIDAANTGWHGAAADALPTLAPAELRCEYCCATLCEPCTMADGMTYCKKCVSKVVNAVGLEIGFGVTTNKVLEHLSREWFPAGSRAARMRLDGNAHWAAGRLAEASAIWSEAIGHCPDAVLLCNRSVARLRLAQPELALADACLAVRLSELGSRMWAKSLFRLGAALNALGGHSASAMAALATVAAWQRVHGESLEPTVRALREAAAGYTRAASLAADPSSAEFRIEALHDELRSQRALARAVDVSAHLPAPLARAAAEEATVAFAARDGVEAVSADKVAASRESVECPLCVELLYEPSALPCGHLLCRPCLSRALDQAFDAPARCPLCRHDLSGFLTWLNVRARASRRAHSHGALQLAVCHELHGLLKRHMPHEVAARTEQVRTDEAAAGQGGDEDDGSAGPTAHVPVFICSLALPGVRCPLHVFEPRYRLMMRRCIDSGRREFGMVVARQLGFGTMLHIDEFNQLPDGRAQLATTGRRRFEVIEWGEKDGYSTARVRWLEDVPLSPADEARASELSVRVREKVTAMVAPLRARAAGAVIEQSLGPIPDDDALLTFWATALLAQNNVQMQATIAFGSGMRTSPLLRVQFLSTLLARFNASAGANGATIDMGLFQ